MHGTYILLTAAKNEERYIGATIESVLAQSLLPLLWLITDDGSSDRTADIVQHYASRHAFIMLQHTRAHGRRCFGSKDRAINASFESVRGTTFEYLGIHDADICLPDHSYFETILNRFADDPRLGIAGGSIFEWNRGAWRARTSNSDDSVAGGIQIFRRACYEEIGGYTPLHYGGEDWLAQIDARMRGWNTCAVGTLAAHHQRPTSSVGGRYRGVVRAGMMDASFGSHPLFEVLKCARRAGESPMVIGSTLRFLGYAWWNLTRRPLVLAPEKAAYLRREQIAKIAKWFDDLRDRSQGSKWP
jgi:hypothetical protein